MSGKRIQPVRGMNDILPGRSAIWQHVEQASKDILSAYGYHEIRFPIVEHTELFARSIGEVTDIVEKEMYTFEDRNGDSLTLRPEGTAGCVRAGISNGLLHNQIQRLWYAGPMFRHERPQKGRYRQFHQIGVEAYGLEGPDIDAEMILLSARLWKRLGLSGLRLEINSLGTPASRERYRDALVEYFSAHRDRLDEDSRRRLETNPLRILDTKNPELESLVAGAPEFSEYLDGESRDHFDGLCERLSARGIDYTVNPRLVRGLDYYTRTVFEWLTDRLGAQGAVCSGGRYDGLVEQLGGRSTPAVGWAMGMERLVDLMETEAVLPAPEQPHAYLIMVGNAARVEGVRVAERLRDEIPPLRLVAGGDGGSFRSQMKKADKSGATYALVLGEEEVRSGTVGVKPLREGGDQETVDADRLAARLRERVGVTG